MGYEKKKCDPLDFEHKNNFVFWVQNTKVKVYVNNQYRKEKKEWYFGHIE